MERTDFKQMRTTKKALIGERIVQEYLETKGFTVYTAADGPHPVDFALHHPQRGWYFADVKTYPRRANYQDTGIDAKDFEKYKALPFPVLLFFVDEIEAAIYVGNLADLTGSEYRGKVYFSLNDLKVVKLLNESQLRELRRFSTAKMMRRYSQVRRYFAL